MPRKTTKKPFRRSWDESAMKSAVESVCEKKVGLHKAAKMHGVPKTSLLRHVKHHQSQKDDNKINILPMGRKPILGKSLEKKLVQYVLLLESKLFGVTIGDIKRLAYDLAVKNKIAHPFSAGEAGRGWVDLFLQRHQNEVCTIQPYGNIIVLKRRGKFY